MFTFTLSDMNRPRFKWIARATLAWFCAVTLFGHALHRLEAHAAHRAICSGHGADCGGQRHADSPAGAFDLADDEHAATSGDCGTCTFYAQAQQVTCDALVRGSELPAQHVRAMAEGRVPSFLACPYDSRGPPQSGMTA